MVITHKQKVKIAIAVSVSVAVVGVVLALYFGNVLVPRYTCKNGACVSDYMGSIKDKHYVCSQTLYTNPSLIFNVDDVVSGADDKRVANSITVLTLGYVDTSKFKAGDLMSWDISATATTTAGNQVCLAGAVVNATAFFAAVNGTYMGWGDGSWAWKVGEFNHLFPGPMVDQGANVLNNSKMTRFGTVVVNKTGVLLLGDKIDTDATATEYVGGPEGSKSGRCTSAASTVAKIRVNKTGAALPLDGIGPEAYLAFIWFTRTTTDPITFSITKDNILFTTK